MYVGKIKSGKSLLRGGPERSEWDFSDGGTKGWISPVKLYQDRKKELTAFLEQKNLLFRAQIVPIDDVYGPAATSKEIEALVVTSETYQGARKVNQKRRELGLAPLNIVRIPLLLAEDRKRISSSRMRIGEIDRQGRSYKLQITSYKLQISDELRRELKKPQGLLLPDKPNSRQRVLPLLKKELVRLKPVMIITVGDEVTKLVKRADMEPNLSIIDFKVARKKKYSGLEELGFKKNFKFKILNFKLAKNPPGHVTKTLVLAVSKAIARYIKTGHNQIIKVGGEEDLAGVPAILLAPLGSVVLYGQPGKGVVVVEVTEGEKERLVELIEKRKA